MVIRFGVVSVNWLNSIPLKSYNNLIKKLTVPEIFQSPISMLIMKTLRKQILHKTFPKLIIYYFCAEIKKHTDESI